MLYEIGSLKNNDFRKLTVHCCSRLIPRVNNFYRFSKFVNVDVNIYIYIYILREVGNPAILCAQVPCTQFTNGFGGHIKTVVSIYELFHNVDRNTYVRFIVFPKTTVKRARYENDRIFLYSIIIVRVRPKSQNRNTVRTPRCRNCFREQCTRWERKRTC